MQTQSRDQLRAEIQNNIRNAIRDATQGGGARIVIPQADALKVLRAEIDGTRAEVQALTQQLTPGLSAARESAIQEQIENATERLTSLQDQLTAAITGRSVPGTAVVGAFPSGPPNALPPDAKNVIIWGMCTLGVTIISVAFIRMWSRWLDRRAHQAPPGPDMSPRLDSIEQAIEAVAIEVERISEGQRYTNKLMSDARALPAPGLAERWPAVAEREPVHARRPGEE